MTRPADSLPDHPATPARGVPVALPIAAFALAVIAACSVGTATGADTATNLLALIDTWARAGVAPLLFLLASLGLGRAFTPWIRDSPSRHLLRLGLGLSLMLSIVHGLGVLGLLNPATSLTLVVIGLALGVHQLMGSGFRERMTSKFEISAVRVSPMSLLLAVPLAIGVVAAASPPGWLWGSEFGGYDALSYHLQLPQEWLREGRVWPLEHNVYSFLPSYLESASVMLAHLTLAPVQSPADPAVGFGLTAGTGWRAMMPQTLHLMITGCAAWVVGGLAATMVRAAPDDSENESRTRRRASLAGWAAATLTMATPWVLVVGTLAYNEMAVVLLGAAAMIAAWDHKVSPTPRAAIAAVLVGVACGCKPTALLFVAPPVGVVLLAGLGREHLARSVALGLVVGLLTLGPWLIRNEIAAGNPVFPALTGVFGDGHYGSSAIARYADAHTFNGTWTDRLRLLVWTNPAAGENAPPIQRFRGLVNPQWFGLGVAGLLAIALLLARAQTRAVGVLLGLGTLAQLLAWLAFTHLQSRFLLPCVLTLAPAVGVAAGLWARSAGPALAITLVLAQTAAGGWLFLSQRDGDPVGRLAPGTSLAIGRPYDAELGAAVPSAYLNNELTEGSVVYLLGDATPFFYETPIRYNTTYDPWPLGAAIAADPGEPAAWTRTLIDRGITHVLIAPAELARLSVSGWIDPAITPQRMAEWTRTLGPPVRVWPDRSARPARALYRLATPENDSP